MSTAPPYLRRRVFPWVLALFFSVLASFGAGDWRAIVRSAVFFVFLTAFLPWANHLRQREHGSVPLILLSALTWGSLGNAAALAWVTSFAHRTLWPWYVLAGGVYHLLFYAAYLYACRRQLHKAPFFLLLMLGGCLGYLFISVPFITEPADVLAIALASVNSVIMVAAYLVLLMTRLNPQGWTPPDKARRRYVLLGLAVVACTWFSAPVHFIYKSMQEFSFWLRHVSSAEAVQNLRGRLRIDTENETVLVDYEPGQEPRLTIGGKTTPFHPKTEPVQALSPDGRYVAVSDTGDAWNDSCLQIRRQDGGEALLTTPIRIADRRRFFWRPDSRTLCLQENDTWRLLTIHDDESVTVQDTHNCYMTQLPPEQDLLFVQDDAVWRQASDGAPEKLLQLPLLDSERGRLEFDAVTMATDRRHLLVLYIRFDGFTAPSGVLATTDLATQKTHLLEILTYFHDPQLTWEDAVHDP